MPRRLCLRCRQPLKVAPYKQSHRYHYACLLAEAAELRDRILALPEKKLTEEEIRALFGEQDESPLVTARRRQEEKKGVHPC